MHLQNTKEALEYTDLMLYNVIIYHKRYDLWILPVRYNMDETDKSIIELINSSSDRDKALEIAFKLALDFLGQLSALPDTLPSSQAASA